MDYDLTRLPHSSTNKTMHHTPWRYWRANEWRSLVYSLTYSLTGAITGLLSLLMTTPVGAAERLYFDYGMLGLSISLQELDTFAETGTMSSSLKPILSRMDNGAQAQLRSILHAQYDVDPVLVNRFSYTRSGQQVLETLGEVVQTESGQNGFYALRSALTLAAAEDDGLTILGFLHHLPTDMRVDVTEGLAIARDLSRLLADTETAMVTLAAENRTAEHNSSGNGQPTKPWLPFDYLPDPRQTGPWQASVQTLPLYDDERDRPIAVDLYTPQLLASNPSHRSPLIVVSNGLGARRSRFDELALHLASHGFAVAMLDHPGSDRQRLQEFYQGLHSENFEATEFIDRPLDVSFVLDELMRLNGTQLSDTPVETAFHHRLDLNQVGIFGYSFGGTTALALAGAEIDRDHLQQACATRSSLFNISLLYQCRALELASTTLESQDLRDERIKATYVYVPFSRSLYGPEGLAQVHGPVFWEANEQDILTPLVIEQLPAFDWLAGEVGALASADAQPNREQALTDAQLTEDGTPLSEEESRGVSEADRRHRHFVVSEGLPHARLTLDVVNRVTSQSVAWEDIKPITETYHQMLTTVFFQVHLAQDSTYCPYLQAEGMQYLAQELYPLHWRTGPSNASCDTPTRDSQVFPD